MDVSLAYEVAGQINIEDSLYGILHREEVICRMYRKFRI
jgi:hypothetical protein